MSSVEYVIRVEGHANSYGLGELIVPNVVLFRPGMYHLSKTELEDKIKATRHKKPKKETRGAR
jgi:hypothetical protein